MPRLRIDDFLLRDIRCRAMSVNWPCSWSPRPPSACRCARCPAAPTMSPWRCRLLRHDRDPDRWGSVGSRHHRIRHATAGQRRTGQGGWRRWRPQAWVLGAFREAAYGDKGFLPPSDQAARNRSGSPSPTATRSCATPMVSSRRAIPAAASTHSPNACCCSWPGIRKTALDESRADLVAHTGGPLPMTPPCCSCTGRTRNLPDGVRRLPASVWGGDMGVRAPA